MDETRCKYVGSFALMKYATHRSSIPMSDFPVLDLSYFKNISENAVIHVCTSALSTFVNTILPTIQVNFKLITNNSDVTIPDGFPAETETLLSNPFLKKWFIQNCVMDHEKIVKIPIGLDYHSMRPTIQFVKKYIWETEPVETCNWGIRKHPIKQEQDLENTRRHSKPFWERDLKGYANFQFTMWTRYGKTDREDAIAKIPKELVFYESKTTTRDICWNNMIKCAFVISPFGNGLDCHRTWEALCLGCIPIVKSSGLNNLFDDLPVWIVNDWSEVTLTNMKNIVELFQNKQFNYEKITLKYWTNKMYSV